MIHTKGIDSSGEYMRLVNKVWVWAMYVAFGTTNFAWAKGKGTVEQIGDYMQVIVPAYAFGMAMNEEGWDGAKQFAYTFGATETAVYGLKFAVNERRPNRADNRSFPSGHTASAMSGAAFIHKRYGLKRAIVPYLMTGFPAYSRVDANKHWWWDTVASAALGGLIAWTIVDRYDGVQVSATPNSIRFRTEF